VATPYERLRAAWDGPQRAEATHHAAEALAAEGVSRDSIEHALSQLLDEIRADGADDDTEEIINTVGDRIAGWCHADHRIHFREPSAAATSANGMTGTTERPVTPA